VSVAVDEAREKDSAPEIDNFDGPRRMRLNVRHGTNFLNAFALDPDGDVFEISPFADIQQLGDFHHDRGCFWRLRIRLSEDRRRASRKNQPQHEHSLFHGRKGIPVGLDRQPGSAT
jgi:hypothetical protein